jgi:CBS domain-containing protein
VNIGEICNRDAATVCASATLNEAARLLSDSYGDAVVAIASLVQRPTAIGIITYRELLNALALGGDLQYLRVLDVLDCNPLILNEEEEIESAILKLRARRTKHAPAQDQEARYGARSPWTGCSAAATRAGFRRQPLGILLIGRFANRDSGLKGATLQMLSYMSLAIERRSL